MKNTKRNELLDEIKSFLDDSSLSWDKTQVINEDCVKGIKELNNIPLDELEVCENYDGDDYYLMDLESYTTKVFNNIIVLVCNVLDSYKENI